MLPPIRSRADRFRSGIRAGVSEYEKIDLQAYEKQADKLVKQLKKYQKDYEYVTFESNIHGDLRKTDVERIRKFFETGT